MHCWQAPYTIAMIVLALLEGLIITQTLGMTAQNVV
jgi:hypothetical protein